MLARRGEPLLDTARMKISGLHNAANALAALALGEAAGLELPAMLAALESFPGLKHRSAWIADIAGVRYIDDSKGTNVGATLAAVSGLAWPLVLIAGGEGKGQDFAPLAAAFDGKVRHVVLIGKDAPALAAALAAVCTTERAATLEAAVRAAAAAARPGDDRAAVARLLRASTCFATTLIAARLSPPRCARSEGRRHERHHHVLRAARARAHAVRVGHGHARPGRRTAARRADHGHLGLDVDRRQGPRRSVLFSRAPVRVLPGRRAVRLGGHARAAAFVGQVQPGALCVFGLLLLLLVLIPGLGATVNGARRWMRIGPMNFQVSELAKVLVLTWVCSYCVRKRSELAQTFSGLAKPVGLLTVAALLLLLEPDFGAATVLFATGFAVLFVAGARLRYVALLVCAAALAFAVLALTSAYRLKRLTGFLHPWDDPFNGGFQLTQSLIAIGRGSWLGVGLGSSVQKLFYLPEAHTDFVFAVLAEELGLAGVIGVLALFVALVWRAFQISRMAAQAGHAVSLLRRARFRRLARPAGQREHRRQHGCAADQGPDAAACSATAAAVCW